MVADMVSDMLADMLADTEVNKVADIAADKKILADMELDNANDKA